jgi:hypothetical protein
MKHNNTEITNSTNTLLPMFQAPEHLDVYDIRNTSYDVQLSVTTMTGHINRPRPRVYLLSNEDDAFWLDEVAGYVPHDVSPIRGDSVLDALLNSFRNCVRGLIIYDPGCVDSINVATTLAGQRDSIVVSPTLTETLQKSAHQLPVVADLRIYQWKNRVQAYRWATRNLLKTASPRLVAGLNPSIAGALRSFLVATRTFVYWLDARKFLPTIGSGWQSERVLMKCILKAFQPGTIHLGWYVNEGTGVRLTSNAAIPMLASDYYYNLEVWTGIQNVQSGERPTTAGDDESPGMEALPAWVKGGNLTVEEDLVRAVERPTRPPKAYVSFTISDGDNLQYNQHRMLRLWRDPVRGSIPIGWTISPALLRAAPALAAYYMRTATPNDELVAGPGGAGYMLPSRWPAEQLAAFLQLTGELMQAMNLGVVEVLDTGLGPGMAFVNKRLQQSFVEGLAPFGIRGVLSGSGQTRPGWRNVAGMAVLQNLGLSNSVDQTIRLIRNATAKSSQKHSSLFLNVYIHAWVMTPSDLKQVVERLGSEYDFVTPGRLLGMIAAAF